MLDLLLSPLGRELEFQITAMVMADQEVRDRVIRMFPPGKPFPFAVFREWRRVDSENTRALQTIMSNHGWPTPKLVGRRASHDAWLLVQHADHNKPFQKRCLKMFESMLGSNDVSKKDYAYLWDRVARGEGRKQRYGTQWTMKDGKFVMQPTEDVRHLDERRKKMKMSSIAEYERVLKSVYRRP